LLESHSYQVYKLRYTQFHLNDRHHRFPLPVSSRFFSNYRPVSHLSFLSKLTERVVKNHLISHLSTNYLLNSYQHHSTESTLLAVHDHIIKSLSEQKVTALSLLDLFAAFDTINHCILLHRLSSWFGLDGTVISWLTSYLSSRSFVVSINSISSAQSPLRQCVKQESVLGPLLFILCTILLVFLSLIRLSVFSYLLMSLNCSSPYGHLNSPPIFYTRFRLIK